MHLSEAVDRLRADGATDEQIREVVGERNARALGIRPSRPRTPAPASGNDLDAWLGEPR